MRKFVVSTMISCNTHPVLNVVITDDIHKILDGEGHPTEEMLKVIVHKRSFTRKFIKDYGIQRTDIYCNYICIDDDRLPEPYKID